MATKRKTAPKKKGFKIKRTGALNKLIGGKACSAENLPKAKRIAKTGTPLQRKQANLAVNIFCPAAKKRKKSK